MPRYSAIKNAFLGGEISPKAYGRTDLPLYLQGANTLLNQMVMPTGGACRRPGTQCARVVSNVGRVLPFIFSETEAYAAHFEIVLAPPLDPVGAIAAYNTSLSNSTTSGVKRALNGSSGMPLPAIGQDDLQKLQYAQSGDIMVIVNEGYKPTIFKRTSLGGFYWKPFDYLDDGTQKTGTDLVKAYPYLDANTTATTLTASATSGSGITITASDDVFNVKHIGAIFKISSGSSTGAAIVTAYTDTKHVTADVLKNFPDTSAHTDWEESAWSDYRGWPRTVAFFQGRLIFGGSTTMPDTLWGSQQYDIEEFMARRFVDDTNSATTDADSYLVDSTFKNGVRNDDPFSFRPNTSRVSYFQWLAAKDVLIAGSTGQELRIYGSNPQLALGPFNFQIDVVTSHGSSYIQPAVTADAVIFVTRDGRTVRALSQTKDSKEADNLTKFADHLTIQDDTGMSRIIQLEYQESSSTIWALTDTGYLLSAFYDATQGIAAWSRHGIAGTDVSVFSMACVPSDDGRNDDLWLHVRRTVNSATVRTLEVIGAPFEFSALDADDATNVDSPFYVDAAFALTNSSPSGTVSALTWLKGETVSILADGAYIGTAVVNASTGNLTLPNSVEATNVVLGLPYASRVVPTRVEAGSAIGSAQGKIKRHDRVVARFYRSAACTFGNDEFYDIDFRPSDTALDAAIPLFTGDKKIDWPGDYDENPDVIFFTSDPLPMTIVSVIMQGVEYDV